MKTKGKSKWGMKDATPVEFYSDLPFEESLHRLQHDAHDLIVDLERQTDDRFRFVITLRGEGEKLASLTGTLQEWGDEATRFEGMLFSKSGYAANSQTPQGQRQLSLIRWMSNFMLLPLLPFVVLLVTNSIIAMIVSLAIIIPVVLLVSGIMSLWNRNTRTVYGRQLMSHLEALLVNQRKAEDSLDENHDDSRREAGVHPDRACVQSHP